MRKPRIIVSRCLGFDNCRYNGQTMPNDFVEHLKDYVEFITVCPEVEIGLGIPRDPVRVAEVKGEKLLYQPATEKEFTSDINKWCEDFYNNNEDIDGFILKNRSPTCGIGDVKVYQGLSKSAKASKGNGFFGDYIIKNYENFPVEDEGRLTNFEIRDHFLIKLYSFTEFKQIRKNFRLRDLVKFHTENKLLFMSYNQQGLKRLGQILANHENREKSEVFEKYQTEFLGIFSKKPKTTAIINVLFHAFGGISKNLTKDEKDFLLNTIEEYRDERIPLSTVTYLLHSLAIRFENEYLISQSLLRPYPKDLMSTLDSSKKVRR